LHLEDVGLIVVGGVQSELEDPVPPGWPRLFLSARDGGLAA
jgi:hypothetical protein